MRSALTILCLLAVLVGCPTDDVGPSAPAERPPAPVIVAEAGEPRLDRSFPVLGEVRTRHRAELAVGVDGPVLSLTPLEGDRVRKGSVLVQVDDAVARAELQAAKAAVEEATVGLQRAQADLARYLKVSADVLAMAEVDRVRADVAGFTARVRSAEARVAEVRARIARHAIRAPFAGVITRRLADPGDWVTPGRVLLEMASTGNLDILVDVAPVLAGLIHAGDAASLQIAGKAVPATVAAVVPVLDPTTRTARVRLNADAPHDGLMPGAPITVVFDTTASLPVGARVPRDALTSTGTGASVVRVRDNVAERVEVQILAESPDAALVQGVSPGDQVVTRGNESLRPGQAVRIAKGAE